MSISDYRPTRWLQTALWIVYAIVWMGGVGGHLLFGGTPPEMSWAAPLFLWLASLLVVVSSPYDWRALAVSALVGFTAEVAGVATGYPFSAYTYTSTLGLPVFGVPLVIAGAWMILIAWVRQLRLPPWLGAIPMVLSDLTIDPLAASTLNFWRWRSSGSYYGVPLLNFAGWYVVSLAILSALPKPPRRDSSVFAVGSSVLLFFGLVGLAHGFFVPSLTGFLLCGAGYWGFISSRVSTRI